MFQGSKWQKRLDQIISEHLADTDLSNERLAAEFEISERQLFRKVKEQTGLSPQKYLRRYRLVLAKQYLENGTYRTVKDASGAVGYINTSYFIHQFEKEFGLKPLKVLQESGWR